MFKARIAVSTLTALTVSSAAALALIGTGSLPSSQAAPDAGSAQRPGGPPPGAPKVESAPKSLTGVSPKLPASVERASSAQKHWRPSKAVYGTASRNEIPVKGAHGTTIRVNEIYPTTRSGKPAKGPFPVLMTMTPYGKGSGGSSKPGSGSGASSPTGGADNYLVQRGYIEVVMDVRGTGDSNGSWGLFDPVQQQDAVKVLHWAAHLPHSTGTVGTYGPSYLGINQLLLAGTVGRHSPLKAIFPVVAANDVYRDTSFMGGLLDFEFAETYLGLTGTLNTANPLGDTATDPQLLARLASIEGDHTGGLATYHAAFTAKVLAGGPEVYDQSYWRKRAPRELIDTIVRNKIPAYLVGGEFDIFQNGEPTNYAAFQNAWAGRRSDAPMRAGQRTTGRYQLIDGPWEHLNGSAVDLNRLQLRWFDTWLKHRDTGMARTRTPLHYYDLGTGRFRETATYPFSGARGHRLYFGPHGTLGTAKPRAASSGADPLLWSPTGSPCGRPIDQWAIGALSIPAHAAGLLAPCADDDRASQVPGLTQTYTTRRFPKAATLAGPIGATVYATATTTETQWVAEVEIVTPDGTSYPLTEGALLGSQRALDQRASWRRDGALTYPFHVFTKKAARPVVPGRVTRYDLQIFPTLATIAKGDRLRVTLATADVPHLVPIPEQLAELAGGVYSVQRTPAHPSSLNVELRVP